MQHPITPPSPTVHHRLHNRYTRLIMMQASAAASATLLPRAPPLRHAQAGTAPQPTQNCQSRIRRGAPSCTLDVHVTHPSTQSVLTCEHEVSLRQVAREAYTRFRIVDGRLEQCWSPLEQAWLRVSHDMKKWVVRAGSGDHDTLAQVAVVPEGKRRDRTSTLCGLNATGAGTAVWLSHSNGMGVLTGIFDQRMIRMQSHPLVRGHSTVKHGPNGASAAGCSEPGTGFRVHALGAPLPQVRGPAVPPGPSSASVPEEETARAWVARTTARCSARASRTTRRRPRRWRPESWCPWRIFSEGITHGGQVPCGIARGRVRPR